MALILAVDQDLGVEKSIVRPLIKLHHRVVVASSVQLALDWLNESTEIPDLIIADVGVRSFGGREFVRALKNAIDWKDIPIMIQTRTSQCEISHLSDLVLLKPYSARELINVVNLVLSGFTRGSENIGSSGAPGSGIGLG